MQDMLLRLLFFLVHSCVAIAMEDSEETFLTNNHKLLGTLLEGYDSGLSPYNTHSTRGNRSLVNQPAGIIENQIIFVRLIRVDEREQQIYTVLVIVTKWRDPRLMWDPSEFGGIDHLYVQADLIWHPEVAACDSSAYTPVLPDHSVFVKVDYEGNVIADRAYAVTYICEFDASLFTSIANFPFDKQRCKLCFFLPIYRESELKLVGTFADDLTVLDTPEWQLGDFDVETQFRDKYTVLFYNISMTRRSEFWVKMLIAPTFLLGCLILVGLLISADDEAKSNAVNLGLTTMMSMTVILGILSENIPKSKDLPVMGHFILYEIVIIEAAVVSVLYSGRISKHLRKIGKKMGIINRCKIAEEGEATAVIVEKRSSSLFLDRVRERMVQWMTRVISVRSLIFSFFLLLHFLDLFYLLSHYRGCWICIFAP